MKVKSLSCVRLFTTPWTVAYQAPPSMGFPRQEYWSGLPLPSPSDALELLLYKTPSLNYACCGPVAFSVLMAALYLSSTCPARPVAASIPKHRLEPLAELQAGQRTPSLATNPAESPLRHGLPHMEPRLRASCMLPCSVLCQS